MLNQQHKDREPKISALPEVVIASRKDFNEELGGRWEVVPVSDPTQSSSDPMAQVMKVAEGQDQLSRTYRVRELIRARVTPMIPSELTFISETPLNNELIAACEQLRLNILTTELGLDMDEALDSPIHKTTGIYLAGLGKQSSYNAAFCYAVQLLGTKHINQFISGVRSVNRDWAKALRSVADAYKYATITRLHNVERVVLSSTSPRKFAYKRINSRGYFEDVSMELPLGFHFVLELANDLQPYMISPEEQKKKEAAEMGKILKPEEGKETEEQASVKMDNDPEGDPGFPVATNKAGKFAVPVLDTSIPLTKDVKGYLHRKKRGMMYGKRIMYPSRLLTDPQRRVFGQKVKATGGVVVIDVSGSMSLGIDDVNAILDAAPGAFVIAYSHGGSWRSAKGEPNITILADRGKQVHHLDDKMFRGGNGVDGPALEFAMKHRKSSEPMLWVSDGYVTDSSDGTSVELQMLVARYCLKNRICQVPDVPTAIKTLQSRDFKPQVFYGVMHNAVMELRTALRRK
jgi:hypothetical protein